MKAVQIMGPGKVALVDRNKPFVKEGYILLKISCVGFCGSDLSSFKGLNPLVSYPVVPGHEIGAYIVEIGGAVPPHLTVGMAVTVNPYTSCGRCSACRNGRSNACVYNQTLGVQRDGAMSEFLLVPWEKIIPGQDLPPRTLALVEPMSVGFHAISRAGVQDIDVVLVLGCGMIGIGALVRAVRRGATVIAVDVSDAKLRIAKKLGVQHTINSRTENLHERVLELTEGDGADVVIEAVGRPETYIAAIQEVAFTGRVVYIGYAKEQIPFETQFFVKKELDIRGSRNALPSDFSAVLTYLRTGECPISDLITGEHSFEQAQEVLGKWSEAPSEVFRFLLTF